MGSPKKPDTSAPPPPAPAPSPMPVPVPSEVAAQTAEAKRAKVAAMRFGLLSTMKTGPGGVTGAGPDLINPTATGAKKKLGE